MSRLTGTGLSWSPTRLGRSLPIYKSLWTARGIITVLILLAGWLAWSTAQRSLEPDVKRRDTAAAEQLVKKRLARTEITPWVPGSALLETDPPSALTAQLPPLPRGRHPQDRPLSGTAAEQAAAARKDFADGDHTAAATRFMRAARSQETWETLYGAGISLLAEKNDFGRALRFLLDADEILAIHENDGAISAQHYAHRIATRYAAGQAALAARNCLDAISHLRLAVRYLKRYVDVEGAQVYERKLPFRVRESGVDNHAVWSSLASAYAACDGKFPEEYPGSYGVQSFTAEYTDADLEEIELGPFPQGIAVCVAGSPQPPSHCWAWSNLNKVLWVSRSYLPTQDGEKAGGRLDGVLVGSLARLLYNVAWLASTSEHEQDRQAAGRWLNYAARLDRSAEVDGLAQSIADLGRYLGPVTGDYSALAEPWRRQDLSAVILDANMPPEELKGVAWALSESWLDNVSRQRPDAMVAATEAQIQRAGNLGDSLTTWKLESQKTMRETLAAEIRALQKNNNLTDALAIRDFRADWLGDRWPARAARAWRSTEMVAEWLGLFLAWLGFSSALWLLYRLVLFPYLVYTADGYRWEHQKRFPD